jgi:hypothetical protein
MKIAVNPAITRATTTAQDALIFFSLSIES